MHLWSWRRCVVWNGIDAVLSPQPFRLLGDFCFAALSLLFFLLQHLLDALLFLAFLPLALLFFQLELG